MLVDLQIWRFLVQQYHTRDTPSWKVPTFSTDMSLLNFTKHSTPDAVFVNSHGEVLCSLNPCNVVYTNGSKSDVETKCACHCQQIHGVHVQYMF